MVFPVVGRCPGSKSVGVVMVLNCVVSCFYFPSAP